MSRHEIQVIDVELDRSNVVKESLDLVKRLRPNWPVDSIQHQAYTSGFINDMTCFFLDSDADRKEEGLIVRVYSHLGSDVIDRHLELLTMQLSAAAGAMKHLVAVFSNGLVYQHSPGRTLRWSDYLKPDILRSLGRTLAQLHFVDYKNISLIDKKGRPAEWPGSEVQLFRVLHSAISKRPVALKDPKKNVVFQSMGMSKEDWLSELDWYRTFQESLGAHTGPCQLDVHLYNTIYDEATGGISLVDYDYGMNGYTGIDVSYPFMFFVMKDLTGWEFDDDPEDVNTDYVRRQYLTSYLERKHELTGGKASDVTDAELDIALVEFELFYYMTFFTMACIENFIADEEVDYDSPGFMKRAVEFYLSKKPRLLELRTIFWEKTNMQ